MQAVKNVKDADVAGKRVLVRVDFNVPLEMHEGHAAVLTDFRIEAVLPTLQLLLERGATKIIVLTHVGRPEGKVVEALRVAPIAERLHALLGAPQVEVMENLRFDPREEANDMTFAKELASQGDVYVNEAFPVSHRNDASIVSLPTLLPSFAGLRFVEEVERITPALNPPAGALAIVGGAKFETKQPLIEKLLSKYSALLLGGALGNDVIKARGWPIGASLTSNVGVPVDIASDERLIVATDAVVRDDAANAERTTLVVDTQDSEAIVDIGPVTAKQWADKVAAAPFVVWNGPLGVYEQGFSDGTDVVAQALVASGAHAVVGGGDTAAAVQKVVFDPAKVWVSTGGGAMLEFLVAGTLPGIEALKVWRGALAWCAGD